MDGIIIYKVLSDGAESVVFKVDITKPQIWFLLGRFYDRELAEGVVASLIDKARQAPLLLPAPEKVSGGGGKASKGKPRGRPRAKAAPKRASAVRREPGGDLPGGKRQSVVAMIQRHVAANAGAFPRGSNIAKETGFPVGTVFSILYKLEEEGLIVRDGERNRHWKSVPGRRQARASEEPRPAGQPRVTRPSAPALPRASRSDPAADLAAIEAHIAEHGIVRVPPAALEPTQATVNSKFEHQPIMKAAAHRLRARGAK